MDISVGVLPLAVVTGEAGVVGSVYEGVWKMGRIAVDIEGGVVGEVDGVGVENRGIGGASLSTHSQIPAVSMGQTGMQLEEGQGQQAKPRGNMQSASASRCQVQGTSFN